MKTKKYLFISILVLLCACYNDDDNAEPTGPNVSNQIFNTWDLGIILENNQIIDDFPCEDDLEYTFNSNGTYTKIQFTTDATDNCVEATSINGNWQAIDDNVLLLTPFSSSFNEETLELSLRNSNNQLQIVRSANLTELYDKD